MSVREIGGVKITCRTSLKIRGKMSAVNPTPLSMTSMTIMRVDSSVTVKSKELRRSVPLGVAVFDVFLLPSLDLFVLW